MNINPSIRKEISEILPDIPIQAATPETIEKAEVSQTKETITNQLSKKINNFFNSFKSLFQKKAVSQKAESQEGTLFTQRASGKAKLVHTSDKTDDENYVFYTPVKGIWEKIFGSKKAEIQEEVRTAATINKALMELNPSSTESYIATDLEEIAGSGTLKGEYVVKAPKAGDEEGNIDLDKLLKPSSKLTMENRLEFGEQILTGLTNLHKAGFIHGDLKGDNILHFREVQPNGETKSVLRVADFGKSRKVKENESVLHTGNPRFAAPEGRSSKKAEVFSAALLLVRILEEEVLAEKEDMLMAPETIKNDQKDTSTRGITKFIVTNENCVHTEARNIPGKIRLLAGFAKAILKTRGEREKTTSTQVKAYIEVLFGKLKANSTTEPRTSASMNRMQTLLQRMVDEDPEKRPSMAEALKEYRTAKEIGSRSSSFIKA